MVLSTNDRFTCCRWRHIGLRSSVGMQDKKESDHSTSTLQDTDNGYITGHQFYTCFRFHVGVLLYPTILSDLGGVCDTVWSQAYALLNRDRRGVYGRWMAH